MRKPRTRTYDYEITPIMEEAAETDRGAAMAFFLLKHTGTIYGKWSGYMRAADQRLLFGKRIGLGIIILNGDDESVALNCSVCFGTMRDTVWSAKWVDLV